uniref:DUF4806 domain-containing protein n=1 Tax=Macrostomum lignano TaxID=282301 RepID=A0A1I8J175_9PLAT
MHSSNQAFTIVEFLEDKSVDYVPSIWLLASDSVAYPTSQSTSRVASLRSKMEKPTATLEPLWRSCSIRVLGMASTERKAREKLKKLEAAAAAGEDTPGLETTDSEAPRQRKPVHRLIDMEPTQKKRKKNKYVSSDDESSKSKSDSETESETDMLQQEDVGDIGSLFSLHVPVRIDKMTRRLLLASLAQIHQQLDSLQAPTTRFNDRSKHLLLASLAQITQQLDSLQAPATRFNDRSKHLLLVLASLAQITQQLDGLQAPTTRFNDRSKHLLLVLASLAQITQQLDGLQAPTTLFNDRSKHLLLVLASLAQITQQLDGLQAPAARPATPVQSAAGCSLEYTSDDDDTIGPGPLDSHLTPSPSRRADNAAPLGTSFLSQFCAEENFRYTGDDETTLMRLVCSTFSLAKENNQLLKQLAASRQMPQLAKLNLPFVLPVSTKDELDQLEQYLRIPKQSTMLASYIGCMVSDSQRKAVFMLMPKFITTQLAASFNYEGKRGGKAAFKDFANTISLVRRLVAQGSKSGKCESNIVKTAIADWLRQAPARLKAT